MRPSSAVGGELVVDPALLIIVEPVDRPWRVGKEEKDGDADEGGRKSFDQEQPLPSAQARDPVEAEQRGRGGAHDGR